MTRSGTQAGKVAALVNQLAEQVSALRSKRGWLAMLRGAVRLHRYSVNNQLLIASQAADRGFTPSHVAGFRAWQEHGRAVRKGEKGLAILAPTPHLVPISDGEVIDPAQVVQTKKGPRKHVMGYRVTHVWDIAQTEAIDGSDATEPSGLDGADAGVPDPAALEQVRGELEHRLHAAGYTVAYTDPGAGRLGTTNPRTAEVLVDPSLDARQQVTTVAHELAHVQLGHTGSGYDYRAHRGAAEVQAESVAFVLLGAQGIDAGDDSVSYVAGWAGEDDDAVRAAAESVSAAAHALLSPAEIETEPDSMPVASRHAAPVAADARQEGTTAARVRYAWRISYTDRPIDLIYDQRLALRTFGERADARDMQLVRLTHHEDGTVTSEDLGGSCAEPTPSPGGGQASIGATRTTLRGLRDAAAGGAVRIETLAGSLAGADLDAATLGEVAALLDAADQMRDAAARALHGLDARHQAMEEAVTATPHAAKTSFY